MTASKRALDLTGSLIGLILLAPLFAVIALMVKADDGGPVFFRQVRIGRGGRPFRLWKFRSMKTRVEQSMLQLTVGEDPRVTPVGAWLRRLKLDELPQLLNVVAGQMSLVGPRPEVPCYVARYDRGQRRVLDLVPGLTDAASLHFRDESGLLATVADPERYYLDAILPLKIQLSLAYADRATVWTDMAMILRTIWRVFVKGPRTEDRRPKTCAA